MARIVNEKRFEEAVCTCYKINPEKGETADNLLCYRPGSIGVLSDKQDKECKDMMILPTPPALEFHFQKFEIMGKEVLAECMKYDNEDEFRSCIRAQAGKHGVKYLPKEKIEPVAEKKPEKKPEEKPAQRKAIFDEKGRLIIKKKSEQKKPEKKPEPQEKPKEKTEPIKEGVPSKAIRENKSVKVEGINLPKIKEEKKPEKKTGSVEQRLKNISGRLSLKEFAKENPDIPMKDIEKTVTSLIATGKATAIDDDVVYLH